MVITAAQLHSTKPELGFRAGSSPAHCVSEIRDKATMLDKTFRDFFTF